MEYPLNKIHIIDPEYTGKILYHMIDIYIFKISTQ